MLEYTVTPVAGEYDYHFTLSVDNHDGSFAPGQGWGWLIFGDVAGISHGDGIYADSPIKDFTLDPGQLPVGPWTYLNSSIGSHNGPTFADVTDFWTPAAVGDSLAWSGKSANFVADGQLLFSLLDFENGAQPVYFDVATEVNAGPSVPDSSSVIALLGMGLCVLFLVRRSLA